MQSWIVLLFFLGTGRSQGTVSSQDVFGILGESVCFPLEIAEELKLKDIFWSHTNIIVHTSLGKIDRVLDGSLEGRLLVPAGSFSLHIQNLREKDSGSYTAQINRDPATDPVITRKYKLHVFSRVQKPNIEVQNVTDESGNITCSITMNCTVENEGKGVNYTWSAEHSEELIKGSVLNVSLMTSRHSLTYTCTASNPASENSTRIALSNFCAEETRSANKGFHTVIAVVTAIVFVASIILAVLLYTQINRTRRKQKLVLEKDTQTVYAQVTKPEGLREREENPLLKDNSSSENLNGRTVYCTVNHSKQQNTETEKSVYDTVKLPGSITSVAYDKVM